MPRLSTQGTDIIITKIDPESSYGSGYLVEIFDSGSKSQEFKVKNKKEVEQVIKDQKLRYNTDRAFQNGLQLHVDYKVDQKLLEGHTSSVKNREKNMDNIDMILLKKAGKIQSLLDRLDDPESHIKVFSEESFQPSLNEESKQEVNPSSEVDDINQQAAEMIRDKLVAYFSDPSSSSGIPDNDLKSWFAQVRSIIQSRASEGYDIQKIVDRLETMFLQEDLPGKDIVLKPIHTSSIETDKFLSELEKKKDTLAAASDLLESDKAEEVAEIIKDKPNKNEVETLLTKIYTPKEYTEIAASILNSVDVYKTKFFDYVKSYKGVTSFNHLYKKWSRDENLTSEFSKLLRASINADICYQFESRYSSVDSLKTVYSSPLIQTYLFSKIADIWAVSVEDLEQYSLNIQSYIVEFLEGGIVDSGIKSDVETLESVAREKIQQFPQSSVKMQLETEYMNILRNYLKDVITKLIEARLSKNPETPVSKVVESAVKDVKHHSYFSELAKQLRYLIFLVAEFLSQDHPEFSTYFNMLAPVLANHVTSFFTDIQKNTEILESILEDIKRNSSEFFQSEAQSHLNEKFGEAQKVVINITPESNTNEEENTSAKGDVNPQPLEGKSILDLPSPVDKKKKELQNESKPALLDYLKDPSGHSLHQ